MHIKNDRPHTTRLFDRDLGRDGDDDVGVIERHYPGDDDELPGVRFDIVPDEAITVDEETGEEIVEFRVANVKREVGEALVETDEYPTISEYNPDAN